MFPSNPCWSGAGRIYLLMVGRIRVSRTFAAGQRSEADFQVEKAEFVGAKSLTIFTALDSLVTMSAVNVSTISIGFLGSSDEVGPLLRRSSRLVITSRISAGTCSSWSLCRPVGMWCDAALRIVRRIFSSLWQSVERERLLRAVSTSSLYLSQLTFFRLT